MHKVKKEDLLTRNRKWMVVSAAMGLSFFLIANFSGLFQEATVLAGFLQLPLNAFVSLTWSQGITKSKWPEVFFKWCGALGPIVFACFTIWNVLYPWAEQFL